MASDRTSLLADSRRSLEQTDQRTEEHGPLDGTDVKVTQRQSWAVLLRITFFFTWVLLATAAVIVLAVWTQHRNARQNWPDSGSANTSAVTLPSTKRNLIFMVSDGMGPASLSLTRSFRQNTQDLPINDTLTLDRYFWGTSRTRSSSSLVTDSAAGATAFSCGKKTINGAISMLPDLSPCGSVLEAAKRAGYLTGLVVTTDVTDATPATFASHVYVRTQEDEIALQEVGEGVLGRVVDMILGGGRCHFLSNSTRGSCRSDDLDVAALAQEKHGWTYAHDRAGFDGFELGENVSLPVLGLFASTDLPFEIDRRNMAHLYPSLSEMAVTAVTALEKAAKDSDKGFFLIIEGSRIDHAGHINDPAAQVREVLEYDKTFKAVIDFLEETDTEGVLVASSDHETGGLSTAWQFPHELPVYNWYPTILAQATASAQHLAHLLLEHISSNKDQSDEELRDWINTSLVQSQLGIHDALETELSSIASNPEASTLVFAQMVSLRARVGWSTHGHSAVDVNVYSSGGPGTEKVRGNIENTDIGEFLRTYLDVDTAAITQELKRKLGRGESPAEIFARLGIPEEMEALVKKGLPQEWVGGANNVLGDALDL